jgi:hypothetical protein
MLLPSPTTVKPGKPPHRSGRLEKHAVSIREGGMVQMPGFRDHAPLTRPDGETGCVTIPVAAASVYNCGTTLQQSWPVVVVRHYERACQQNGRLALHVADGVGVRESARANSRCGQR